SAPPRDGSQRKSSPKASVLTAARVKSPRPANHLAAVSGACFAVEKWMKPSARSTDAPVKPPPPPAPPPSWGPTFLKTIFLTGARRKSASPAIIGGNGHARDDPSIH